MVYYQLDTILRMTQTDTDRAWAYFEWRLKSQWQCNVYEDLDIQWGVQIVSADMNIPNTWQPQQPQFSANVAAVARSNHNFSPGWLLVPVASAVLDRHRHPSQGRHQCKGQASKYKEQGVTVSPTHNI